MDLCTIHIMVLEKAGGSVTLLLRGLIACLRLPRTVVVFGPGILCGPQVLMVPFLLLTTGQPLLGKLSSLLHAYHGPFVCPH